ncbi:MAG: hypothetical protein ABI886_17175 [Betaproteobacteria bacterium]
MFKIEIEDGHGLWFDVCRADGAILTFEGENEAQAKLGERHPLMVQMERDTGGKRTRVVRVFRNDDEWKHGTPAG